jgi:hypothetical protein
MRLHLQQISSEISPFGCGDLAVSGGSTPAIPRAHARPRCIGFLQPGWPRYMACECGNFKIVDIATRSRTEPVLPIELFAILSERARRRSPRALT